MRMPTKSGLIKVILLAGGVALAAKLVTAKKDQWQGLNESQVREKVASKMPDRVPEEKREAVADKVVGTMRSRGLLSDEVVASDTQDQAAEESDAPVGEDTTPHDPVD